MADTRDWKAPFSSCTGTILFSITAYASYGRIIHRSTWDRQHLYLPLLFLLFPEIFLCQIFMNIILVIQRYRGMHRLRVTRDSEGFWFYICSVLDLHSKEREFEPQKVFIAGAGGSHEQRSEGMWRLSTLNSSRLSYVNKYRTDFDRSKYLGQLVFTLILLYQGLSACMAYIRRVVEIRNGTLAIDHLTGIYAISSTILGLATLVMIAQPYEWTDSNEYIERERLAMPDVDTSNAWVYEGFMALVVHGLTWLSLRVWIFFAMLSQRKELSHSLQYTPASLFTESFSGVGIAILGLVCAIGIPLMVPTIGEVMFNPHRHGMVWLSHKTRMSYYAGAITFRSLLAILSVAVASMIWVHAAQELIAVQHGQTRPWNADWKKPTPGAQTAYGAFLGLWSG